ncbi:MAG: hypothetical protein N2D54_11665, partial [Chloroflexota bacterium]
MLQNKFTFWRKLPSLLVVLSLLGMTIFTVPPAAAIGELPPGLTRLLDADYSQWQFEELEEMGDKVYFSYHDGVSNQSLWATDGTVLGTDEIGPDNNWPDNITAVGNLLYYEGYDGAGDYEPWVSDGTTPGTELLKDINSGNDSWPYDFIAGGGNAYFLANNGTDGYELYVSNGTEIGTSQVANWSSGS